MNDNIIEENMKNVGTLFKKSFVNALEKNDNAQNPLFDSIPDDEPYDESIANFLERNQGYALYDITPEMRNKIQRENLKRIKRETLPALATLTSSILNVMQGNK